MVEKRKLKIIGIFIIVMMLSITLFYFLSGSEKDYTKIEHFNRDYDGSNFTALEGISRAITELEFNVYDDYDDYELFTITQLEDYENGSGYCNVWQYTFFKQYHNGSSIRRPVMVYSDGSASAIMVIKSHWETPDLNLIKVNLDELLIDSDVAATSIRNYVQNEVWYNNENYRYHLMLWPTSEDAFWKITFQTDTEQYMYFVNARTGDISDYN